jgi:hypothetical protein
MLSRKFLLAGVTRRGARAAVVAVSNEVQFCSDRTLLVSSSSSQDHCWQRFFSTGSSGSSSSSTKAEKETPVPSLKQEQKDTPSTSTSSVSKKKKKNPGLDDLPIAFSDISRAAVAIRGGVVRTECRKSYFLSELIGANVYIKPEVRQFTGSFKERGARNAIIHVMKENPNLKGVIAASAGNHALALAYHGKELGIPVTVVMPTVAPMAKVDKCRQFGANIVIHGAHIGEAKEFAETLVEKEGLTYINGYDDPPICAGAGTIGIEIIEDVPEVDAVVVPVGGAGLIAGVSCAVKTLKPECKVRKFMFSMALLHLIPSVDSPTIPIFSRSLEWNQNTVLRTPRP